MSAEVHTPLESAIPESPHRDFYQSATGRVAARVLRERLLEFWPDLTGQRVLGLGHAAPYLRLWRDRAERVLCAMPAELGPQYSWPRSGPSLSTLVEETELPFPDFCFDNVLLVHGLETAENGRRLLREVWRVLKEDGRLLVVVPNRRGIWAHSDTTPFGQGRPYSPGQISRLLSRTMFTVERRRGALFIPPFQTRLLLRGAGVWERAGRALVPRFAGVTLVEARKEMFGAMPVGALPAKGRRVLVPAGVRFTPVAPEDEKLPAA
ncbi:methyltransferase domain-containing protein [Pseudoroseomonas wenyumeiae]|uniref:Methyltransferase domain-containing protein n=1 Tax=Teichococcus wenyumeiae TaxID=2478470 RepID=A0A3A9JD08_9PROT|nr:methyltransferase domain-containing protein [Pseudoroseomonas wenyumeiae]RKK01354.1 methyltransferase domain-containing protein [Pseudoroseomonas wenyumeiae]RMI24899.1 methyltransferase domain-containing protein [Pseudoroseomonas wenyumeiae]